MYCHGAKVATGVGAMELAQLGWSGPMTMIVHAANRPQTVELRLDGKLYWESGIVWERGDVDVSTEEDMALNRAHDYPLSFHTVARYNMTKELYATHLEPHLRKYGPEYLDSMTKYHDGAKYLECCSEIMPPVPATVDHVDLINMALRIQRRAQADGASNDAAQGHASCLWKTQKRVPSTRN